MDNDTIENLAEDSIPKSLGERIKAIFKHIGEQISKFFQYLGAKITACFKKPHESGIFFEFTSIQDATPTSKNGTPDFDTGWEFQTI